MSDASLPHSALAATLTVAQDCLSLTVGRSVITFRAGGDATADACTLLEVTLPAGQDLGPAHRHDRALELCYALSGSPTVLLGDHPQRAPPGACVVVPPGTPHAYRNDGRDDARFRLLAWPAGHERYYEDLAGMLARTPGGGPLRPEQLARLSERHALHFTLD